MLKKFKDIRIAVIVALAEEYKLFCEYFNGRVVEKFHVNDTTIDILERNADGSKIGLVCINKMGNVAAAIAATRVLEVFDLDLVVNIGLAAGTRKDQQSLGDIIVANKIRYYESGKLAKDKLEFAPEYADLNSIILNSLQSATASNWPLGASLTGRPRQVQFGTVASGEKVIASSNFVSQLLAQDRKTVGIEMEGYGISAALFGRNEKFLLIRGICDFADDAKNDSARLSAMEGAIRYFDEALKRNIFKSAVYTVAAPDVHPKTYALYFSRSETLDGIANNYIQVTRNSAMDSIKRRRSLIQNIAAKYTMGTIRTLCIEMEIDFDEIIGETKTEKIANILEYVERKGIMTIEDLEAVIDDKI